MKETENNKLSVLLVKPLKEPRMIEIDDTLEAMQKTVGGYIEQYMPFEDEVAIVCNDESKFNGMIPNRAIYMEPDNFEITYNEMKSRFRQAERDKKTTVGYIVFTEDSFDAPYTEEQRTYEVRSNCKAFMDGMCGYSIFGISLDGEDVNVRLDTYMADEHGGKNGWKIERCYMPNTNQREIADIVFGQFFVCYAPWQSENFLSLPEDLAKKYMERFKTPELFAIVDKKITVIPCDHIPKGKDR